MSNFILSLISIFTTVVFAGLLLQQPQPPSGAWLPTSEGLNCSFWLDSTDNGTIAQTATVVTTWTDKCHNAYTFNSTAVPVNVTAAGINGLQVIGFNQSAGTSGLVGPAQYFVSTSTPWTIAFAVKLNTYTNHQTTFLVFSPGSGSLVYGVTMADSSQTGFSGLNFSASDNSFLQGYYNHTFTTGTVFKAVITYSGSSPTSAGSYTVYVNGVSQTVSTTAGMWTGTNTQLGTTLGVTGGYATYGGTWYAGDVMFFSETSGTLTSKINTYLSRWGV